MRGQEPSHNYAAVAPVSRYFGRTIYFGLFAMIRSLILS
jgi:hypothetical protein